VTIGFNSTLILAGSEREHTMAETAFMALSVVSQAPDARLARAWSAALAVTGDETGAGPNAAPVDAEDAQTFLTTQSAMLLAILFGEPFRPRRAAAVGRELVKADFVGANVLGRSLRVLILRLPELLGSSPGDLEQRVAEVTEALANGYVHALRDRTLAEQESIRHAELDAQRIISEQLRHQATHDPLTGLPNRAAVFGRLSTALDAGPGAKVGLCYLDLDGFKTINDRYGHEVGDELLVTVAERIGEVTRARGALAGRIGGDEFVVLAEPSPSVAGMVALANAILAEVSRPIPLRIGRVRVSACAGIVECEAGSPAAATIVANADAALYHAKSIGPGHWAVYDSSRRQGLPAFARTTPPGRRKPIGRAPCRREPCRREPCRREPCGRKPGERKQPPRSVYGPRGCRCPLCGCRCPLCGCRRRLRVYGRASHPGADTAEPRPLPPGPIPVGPPPLSAAPLSAAPLSASAPASPVRGAGPGPAPVEARMKSAIAATTAPGSSVTAGCSRKIAAAVPAAIRIRWTPRAITSDGSGSAGPKPRLASCRSRRMTALRWPPVSPGSRYTVAPRTPGSTMPCNPPRSLIPDEKSG
jgi:diguanylate cyclase (GGDEF)-like protein